MNKTARILSIIGLVIACGSTQPCSADTSVTLRTDVELRRPTVKLSDVFQGVPSSIDTEIAQAPAPGKQVTYDMTVLKRIADKYRLAWEPLNATDRCVITSASTRITADAIRDAVIAKIKETEQMPKNGTVDVAFDNRLTQIDLPADRSANFAFSNFDYDDASKRFRADIVADGQSGSFSVPIMGHITVKRRVPVLAHRLQGGTVVGEADIDWSQVTDDRINLSVVTDASQILGRELRRDTDEGAVLYVNDFIPPRLVTRGSIITMKIETSFMQVTAQGKALQDGAKGDVIRVTNTQSNRTLEGTVTGPGTVTIGSTSQKFAAVQ